MSGKKEGVRKKKKQIVTGTPDTFAGKLARYIFFALLAYMPLHIFLSTWIGTTFDVLAPAKVAKEFVMLFGFGLVVAASVRQPWFKGLFKDRLVWLIAAFGLLHVILMAMRSTDPDAQLLALAYNTRYLVFFIYAILLAHLSNRAHLVKRSVQVVLGASIAVLIFGVLQYNVLPHNTLEKAGYSQEAGVLPVFFIDNNPDYPRVFSTQRNPNAYGGYLLIIVSLAVVYLRAARLYASRYILVGILGLSLINLLLTYSRSAWIGFISIVLLLSGLLLMQKRNKKLKRDTKIILIAIFIGAITISASMLYALGDSKALQNIILHTSSESVADSSDVVRLGYWNDSVSEIVAQPLGAGPGESGPVSMHTDSTRINENYYLQIATETGIAGIALLLSILVTVFLRLWRQVLRNPIAAALVASFVGLAITNMFAHTWMYESVAYTWWGLAGLLIVLDAEKQRVKSKKKKA